MRLVAMDAMKVSWRGQRALFMSKPDAGSTWMSLQRMASAEHTSYRIARHGRLNGQDYNPSEYELWAGMADVVRPDPSQVGQQQGPPVVTRTSRSSVSIIS